MSRRFPLTLVLCLALAPLAFAAPATSLTMDPIILDLGGPIRVEKIGATSNSLTFKVTSTSQLTRQMMFNWTGGVVSGDPMITRTNRVRDLEGRAVAVDATKFEFRTEPSAWRYEFKQGFVTLPTGLTVQAAHAWKDGVIISGHTPNGTFPPTNGRPPIPEPSAALAFAAGALLVRWGTRARG